MAGSFDVFRKYQRSLLVAVAVLAMLAFFVLPPFLQMAPEPASVDPFAATWQGGGIREGELQREVAMRVVLNQFLRDAIAASGRDPGTAQVLGEDEEDVVRTLLLAREAEANGIVIGNGAVNQFLAQWTNNMVRPEQFEALIAGRRLAQVPVSADDIFAALRTVLAADRMRQLSFAGFGGDPPGARWEIFKRLEQEATIEVVPVLVESLAGDVPAPTEAVLRAFFDRFKDALPVDRSPDPGFKEPYRISYDWIAATREDLEAAAAKDVTDEAIEKFYEENKVRLYRAKPAAVPAPEDAKTDGETKADGEKTVADPAKEAGGTKGVDGEAPKPAEESKPAAEAKPAEDTKSATDAAPATEPNAGDEKALRSSRSPFRAVKFRQVEPVAGDATKPEPAAPQSAEQPSAKDEKAPGSEAVPKPDAPAADSAAKPAAPEKPEAAADAAAAKPAAETAPDLEPLEKVRDDVRKRLAAEAVDRRVDELFRAITGDVIGFSRDLSRWKAESGAEANRPAPPDVEAIAAKQGLKAGRGTKRTAGEAVRDGGVGSSFQLSLDPRSPMGFRQAQWGDLFFRAQPPLWRPVETRDVPGNRYLTWKTEDFPSVVPEFDAVRADVERAWRIVEARGPARKLAADLAAAATGGKTLADVVAGRTGTKLEARAVGPFTWVARDAGAFGAPVAVSQPEGLEMPGEDFMKAVFALEPGAATAAFNEPQTVCYAIRLVSYSPPDEDLRKRFLDPAADRSRMAAVVEGEQSRAFRAWLVDVEKRAALEWKRPPQRR